MKERERYTEPVENNFSARVWVFVCLGERRKCWNKKKSKNNKTTPGYTDRQKKRVKRVSWSTLCVRDRERERERESKVLFTLCVWCKYILPHQNSSQFVCVCICLLRLLRSMCDCRFVSKNPRCRRVGHKSLPVISRVKKKEK